MNLTEIQKFQKRLRRRRIFRISPHLSPFRRVTERLTDGASYQVLEREGGNKEGWRCRDKEARATVGGEGLGSSASRQARAYPKRRLRWMDGGRSSTDLVISGVIPMNQEHRRAHKNNTNTMEEKNEVGEHRSRRTTEGGRQPTSAMSNGRRPARHWRTR